MGQVEPESRTFNKERLDRVPAAGVLIVRRDGERIFFLLARRLDQLEHLRYSPPGGKLKPGEDFSQCAIREVEEETGLIIGQENLTEILAGTQDFTLSGRYFEYHGFFIFWDKIVGELENKEPDRHLDWEWIAEERLVRLIMENQLSEAAEILIDCYYLFFKGQGLQQRNVIVGRLLPESSEKEDQPIV